MFEVRISHEGLKAFRLVKGHTPEDVQAKAALQIALWEDRWKRKLAADKARFLRERKLTDRAKSQAQGLAAKDFAQERTRELEEERNGLDNTLLSRLNLDLSPDWNDSKDHSAYQVEKPVLRKPAELPREPLRTDADFIVSVLDPHLSFLDRLIPSQRRKRAIEFSEEKSRAESESRLRHENALKLWRDRVHTMIAQDAIDAEVYRVALRDWTAAREDFLVKRASSTKASKHSKRATLPEIPKQSPYTLMTCLTHRLTRTLSLVIIDLSIFNQPRR